MTYCLDVLNSSYATELIMNIKDKDLNNFLSTLFKEHESAWFVLDYRKRSRPIEISKLAEVIMNINPDENTSGAKIGLNPATPNQIRRTENTSKIRNILVEFDNHTKEEQCSLVNIDLQMPFSTAVWSGNRSVHFVICLQKEITLKQYKQYTDAIKKAFRNKADIVSPAATTRLPIGFRSYDQKQYLMENRGLVSNLAFENWLYSDKIYQCWKPEKKTRKHIVRNPKSNTTLESWLGENHPILLEQPGQHAIRCPHCEEIGKDRKRTNLSLNTEDTRSLIHCHAGCEFSDIMNSIRNSLKTEEKGD